MKHNLSFLTFCHRPGSEMHSLTIALVLVLLLQVLMTAQNRAVAAENRPAAITTVLPTSKFIWRKEDNRGVHQVKMEIDRRLFRLRAILTRLWFLKYIGENSDVLRSDTYCVDSDASMSAIASGGATVERAYRINNENKNIKIWKLNCAPVKLAHYTRKAKDGGGLAHFSMPALKNNDEFISFVVDTIDGKTFHSLDIGKEKADQLARLFMHSGGGAEYLDADQSRTLLTYGSLEGRLLPVLEDARVRDLSAIALVRVNRHRSGDESMELLRLEVTLPEAFYSRH
jgi:hypothetical protein